jgi:hypothetical protein
MPAKINIIRGVSAGASHWLERPVLRIGSHPDVDLCVPSADLDEHVATVEYRDGTYVIYNRAATSIRLDGHDLAPGGSAVWSHNAQLDLGGDTTLQLELTGDGLPSPRPVKRRDDADYDDANDVEAATAGTAASQTVATSGSAKESSLKMIGQVAVILFCFLAMGVIVYSQFVNPAEPAGLSGTIPDINKLLESLSTAVNKPQSDGDRQQIENLLRMLKQAEFSRLRGDTREARRLFESLRSQLLRRQSLLDASHAPEEADLLTYVLHRLS